MSIMLAAIPCPTLASERCVSLSFGVKILRLCIGLCIWQTLDMQKADMLKEVYMLSKISSMKLYKYGCNNNLQSEIMFCLGLYVWAYFQICNYFCRHFKYCTFATQIRVIHMLTAIISSLITRHKTVYNMPAESLEAFTMLLWKF